MTLQTAIPPPFLTVLTLAGLLVFRVLLPPLPKGLQSMADGVLLLAPWEVLQLREGKGSAKVTQPVGDSIGI